MGLGHGVSGGGWGGESPLGFRDLGTEGRWGLKPRATSVAPGPVE